MSKQIIAGGVAIGGGAPVTIQSMCNTHTEDAKATIAQIHALEEAGCEIVRVTVPNMEAAHALSEIKENISIPLVADIHFDYRLAVEAAARGADKIRINPGNIGGDDRVKAVVDACREHKVPIRIGVNGGSLEKELLAKYGRVTPEALVESALRHVRLLEKFDFTDICISVKSSDVPLNMAAYRLLHEKVDYPLHLGVTEAGEGEDGRIKSAVGIGALLADGIGDTIRVSLSEEPEAEIPVARHLVDYITKRAGHTLVPATEANDFSWVRPERRPTRAAGGIGGSNTPVVIASCGQNDDAESLEFNPDMTPDYIYCGASLPKNRRDGQKYIVDFNAYTGEPNTYPIFPYNATPFVGGVKAEVKFLVLQLGAPSEEYMACLKAHPEVVVVAVSNQQNRLGEQRALAHELWSNGLFNPVVFAQMYGHSSAEKADLQLEAAADMGALMIDGLTDGLWLMNNGDITVRDITDTAFAILQAARLRTSKTEYISCPGCGRTLYDLRSTIAKIKAATAHMKGLKIGIMGCIVNGPGEMADADYGYVGAGPGKISLYKQKMCVEKAIPESEAVEHLLRFIEEDRKKH